MKINKDALKTPKIGKHQLQKAIELQQRRLDSAKTVLAHIEKMAALKEEVLAFLNSGTEKSPTTEKLTQLVQDFNSDDAASSLAQLLKDREVEDEGV